MQSHDLFGQITLISLLLSMALGGAAFVWSVIDFDARILRLARISVILDVLFVALAVGRLEIGFLTHDFHLRYVYEYSSRDLSLFYVITGLWGGLGGSILLWVFVLTILTFIVTLDRRFDEDVVAYAAAVLCFLGTFFVAITLAVSNPFESFPLAPDDGLGLNPLLQMPMMVIHPPMLYTGYVGLSVPFAYAIGSLITGKIDDSWLRRTRLYTMIAWTILGFGILLGSWWAYTVLSFGGYWAWDPVENASFMPWLACTAFIHSTMIQERKGMFKGWNFSLIIITFLLTIVGTFITRTGVVNSVHAFGLSNGLKNMFLLFMGVLLISSFGLVIYRLPLLRAERPFTSYLSKEGSFYFNNLILLGLTLAIFVGTFKPLWSTQSTGQTEGLQTAYYNDIGKWFAIALLVLLGICPLLAWTGTNPEKLMRRMTPSLAIGALSAIALLASGVRDVFALFALVFLAVIITTTFADVTIGTRARMSATKERPHVALGRLLTRNHRRFGGYTVHLGFVMVMLAIVGSGVYRVEAGDKAIAGVVPGEAVSVGQYRLEYRDYSQAKDSHNRQVTTATFDVYDGNAKIGTIAPTSTLYNQKDPQTGAPLVTNDVVVRSTPINDLWITGAFDDALPQQIHLKVIVFPLMFWLWTGGAVMILGSLYALVPRRRPTRETEKETGQVIDNSATDIPPTSAPAPHPEPVHVIGNS